MKFSRTLSVSIKIAAAVLLIVALTHPDVGGLKSKGIGVRTVVYPLGLLTLPLLWGLLRRWRNLWRLNWTADALCGLPILVDLVGNRANLYDTVWWWDDAAHFAKHGVLTEAYSFSSPRRAASRDRRGRHCLRRAIGPHLGAGGVRDIHAFRGRAVRCLPGHPR